MVWADNLNFPLKMTVDGISQWNFVLVSLFKLPQKKTRFFIVYLFLFSEWVLRFFNCKNLSPKLASQLWPVKYTSDLNMQTGSCLCLSICWASILQNFKAFIPQFTKKNTHNGQIAPSHKHNIGIFEAQKIYFAKHNEAHKIYPMLIKITCRCDFVFLLQLYTSYNGEWIG